MISRHQNTYPSYRMLLAFLVMAMALCLALPYLFASNRIIGFVDAGVWQLLLIAFIAWLLAFWLSLAAFRWLLENLGLPTIYDMVQQFNKLTLWQRLRSYFWLFACLLGSVGLTIAAVL